MIGDQPVGNEGRVAPLSQIGVSTGTKVVSWTRDHRRFRYWVRFDGGEAYLFLRNHEPYLGKDGSAEILRTLR